MHPRRVVQITLSLVVLCAWCGWVSGFARGTSSAIATWCVSVTGVVGVTLLMARGSHNLRPGIRIRSIGREWPPPGRDRRREKLAGTLPWLLLVLVLLAWELLGIDTGANEPHLTISALSKAFRPLNAALLFVWISIGLGYGVARARAPIAHVPPPGRRPPPEMAVTGALVGIGIGPKAPVTGLLLPASRGIGVAFWLGIVVVGALIDIAARRSHGRFATAEELLRFLSRTPVARVVLVLGWAYAGWHLFGG